MERKVIIGGSTLTMGVLGQPLDGAFDRLHGAYFGTTPYSWEEFDAAAQEHFTNDPNVADKYFTNFTILWSKNLQTGNFAQAEEVWKRALQPALDWEQAGPNRRLHKGTPYYFWAMTALLRGDTDHGYLLAHQAVDEDIISTGQPTPDTPGYALVSLNFERVDQAFRQWVLDQANFLNEGITNYNNTHQRTLTIENVKRRFIDHPPNIETVFLLTYTIARLMKLNKLPNHSMNNPFAGQLELNLFFDITLVIDAAIKAKNQQHQFIDHAGTLLTAAGATLTNAQLRDINTQFNNNFDATLLAAVDGTLTVQPNVNLNRLQCDIALAYGLRNQGAHNTGTAPTIWNRFTDVQQTLFRTLCAAIDYLYP